MHHYSQSLPDLTAMLSSPVEMYTRSISTSCAQSGSMPSLQRGECERLWTRRSKGLFPRPHLDPRVVRDGARRRCDLDVVDVDVSDPRQVHLSAKIKSARRRRKIAGAVVLKSSPATWANLQSRRPRSKSASRRRSGSCEAEGSHCTEAASCYSRSPTTASLDRRSTPTLRSTRCCCTT